MKKSLLIIMLATAMPLGAILPLVPGNETFVPFYITELEPPVSEYDPCEGLSPETHIVTSQLIALATVMQIYNGHPRATLIGLVGAAYFFSLGCLDHALKYVYECK